MLWFRQIHFWIWTNTEWGVWRQGGSAEAAAHTVSAGRPVASQGTLFWMSNTIWTNKYFDLDKYILEFGQIHFTIWTNNYFNLDKFILEFGQMQKQCRSVPADKEHCSEYHFVDLYQVLFVFFLELFLWEKYFWAAKSCLFQVNTE